MRFARSSHQYSSIQADLQSNHRFESDTSTESEPKGCSEKRAVTRVVAQPECRRRGDAICGYSGTPNQKIARNCSQVPYKRCLLLLVIKAVQQGSDEADLACSLKNQFDRGLISKLFSGGNIRAFVINTTTVLPTSGLVGDEKGARSAKRRSCRFDQWEKRNCSHVSERASRTKCREVGN